MQSREISPAEYRAKIQSNNRDMMSTGQEEIKQNFSDFFTGQRPRYLSGAGMAAATQHYYYPNAMWNYKYETSLYNQNQTPRPMDTDGWGSNQAYDIPPNLHGNSHFEIDTASFQVADEISPALELNAAINDRNNVYTTDMRTADMVDPEVASYQAFNPASSWNQRPGGSYAPPCDQLSADIYSVQPAPANIQQPKTAQRTLQSNVRNASEPVRKWQDANGIWWLTVSYQKRGFSNKLDIHCDMEGYKTAVYSKVFQQRNCIYPNALVHPSEYHGHRQNYEMDCNLMAWRLVSLNPVLDSQRGLIQRAVDSYRNSSGDPSTQSRRTQRLAKRQARAEQQALAASGRRRKRKRQAN